MLQHLLVRSFLFLSFQEGYECDNRAVINLSLENETYFGKLCYRLTGEGKFKGQDSHASELFLGRCGHLLIRMIDSSGGGFQCIEIAVS